MTHDLLDLYSRASEWTLEKVKVQPPASIPTRPATGGTCAS